MVSLLDKCSLDVNLDDRNNSLHCGESVTSEGRNVVSIDKLIPTLLNKSLSYPRNVYEELTKVFHQDDIHIKEAGISVDVLCLPPGLLGIEFVKTHIYFAPEDSKGSFSCMVEVQLGILTIIMQKNMPREELEFGTRIAEGVVVKLRVGEKMAIPKGFHYNFVNTEEVPVVFLRIYKNKGSIDYSQLRREGGLAYYCIRKNARQEIVQNPLYRSAPKIKNTNRLDLSRQALDFIDDIALYTQLRAKTKMFHEMLYV